MRTLRERYDNDYRQEITIIAAIGLCLIFGLIIFVLLAPEDLRESYYKPKPVLKEDGIIVYEFMSYDGEKHYFTNKGDIIEQTKRSGFAG